MVYARSRTNWSCVTPSTTKKSTIPAVRFLNVPGKKHIMKSFVPPILVVAALIFACTNLLAQNKKIVVDVGHGQRFYSDPADNISTQLVPTDRLKYMTGELAKNGAAHNASIGYLKKT